MGYIIGYIILLILYVSTIYLMKYMKNKTITNLIFMAVVFVPYVMLCITVYRDVGWNDWNFQTQLPMSNVSPFMFASMLVILFLPKNIKKHCYLLISLLSVGMFLSTTFNSFYFASIGYKFHIHFMFDYVAHFALSLFGVYLVRSRQVELDVKSCIISSLIIVGVATVMLILNLCFDTAYFGLSLTGKHNIYNIVLVNNSYLSALIYYFGLCLVLFMGYIYSKIFYKYTSSIDTAQ